jgi:transcriptional regulator with XRE-family HTH domain
LKTVKTTAILKETICWTLTDVANNIRVSLVTIGYYKRSESMPSIDAAKKIADNFEVLLNYMVENRNLLLKKIPKHVHYLQKP